MKNKGLLKFDLMNLILLAGLITLPIAGLLLHLKLHPDLTYLTYILLFDIVIITALYLFKRTGFYAFALNSVFFMVGVIMHFQYLGMGGLSDVLISIPDFSIGYVLWRLNK